MRKIRRNVVVIAICSAVLMTFAACEKDDEGGNNKNVEISLSNKNDAKQSAFADDASTGQGFTFTAKDDWVANVKDTGSKGGGNATWIKLTLNGVETYSGEAGTYTLTITIETNYTGERREATIEIVCGTDRITVTVTQEGTTKGGETPVKDPVELTSPISVNTTLKKLGLPVDYVFKSSGYLQVTGTAVLTIEPGVTIQFSNTGNGGGLQITSAATIKATGTANDRIRFIGAVDAAGSWRGLFVESRTDNRFDYCDFLNMGKDTRAHIDGFILSDAKAGITHCKFTNGLGAGFYAGGNNCELTDFNNNVIEGYVNQAPVVISSTRSLHLLEKFDMTSDFTRNTKQYIETRPYFSKEITLNQTTVPYYFVWGLNGGDFKNTLTINEGVTIYMENGFTYGGYTTATGRLIVNGTASKKVKFTRLPGSSGYWGTFYFDGLKGSVINHCIFEYGGLKSGALEYMLYITSSTELTLNNVEINNSDTYGVVVNASGYTLKHSNVTFSNNRSGNVWDRSVSPNVVRTHFP